MNSNQTVYRKMSVGINKDEDATLGLTTSPIASPCRTCFLAAERSQLTPFRKLRQQRQRSVVAIVVDDNDFCRNLSSCRQFHSSKRRLQGGR